MQETVVSLQQAPDSTSRLMFSAPFLVNHNRDSGQLLCFAASNAWLRVDFRRAI
jgi:hypothetical protein